jgi:glycosyltransferase involved in cell wall biosynthesis
MRIAIFTNNYLPNSFGVANSVEAFRRDFEKLGHQVYIFAPKWPGYVDASPNVFRYPSLDIKIKIRFPLAIPYSWKMRKILKNLDLDIIHAQHPNLLGTVAARWARKLARRRGGKKIPLIFTWHTRYDLYTHFFPFLPPKISAGFMIRKAVKFANNSDTVIVPTDSIIPILKNWGVKNKIIPIATGVETEQFSAIGGSASGGKNADGKKIREKYGVGDDETLLFVISRFTAEKNMEFLFQSVARVLQKNKKVKFMAGADGYLRPELEKIVSQKGVSDQVIFAGHIPDDIKKHYFAAADIFVFASKSETQGMVISEAMYMGLPIVAVNATGINSLVLNKANGFLVDENIDKFAEAVEKLINDRELRQKFSEASKKIARENFTSDICAKKMIEVYEKAIENYSR